MLRPASAAELIAIEKNTCPHCGSDDIDMDFIGSRAVCDICNVCSKSWTTYTNGRIELEGGIA